MKRVNPFSACIQNVRKSVLTAGLSMLLFIPGGLLAQTDSTQQEKPAGEEKTMIAPSIEFKGVQKSDSSVDLKASLKAKINGFSTKLSMLKISFVEITDTAEKPLGSVVTDVDGRSVFTVSPGELSPDKDGKLHFKAVFAGNKLMDAAEEEVTFDRARLEITPIQEDSATSVQIKLVDLKTGKPVPETVVGIFVQRLFKPLKIGEGTTDENGEANVEIPKKLPGDDKGNITLIAKLDDNDTYGNLLASTTQKWGVPISNIIQEQPRALWSSHPPLWMLITFIVLMVVVWGHYIVIVYELFRLRKEEPHAPTNATIP